MTFVLGDKEKAFETFKYKLTHTPALVLLDFAKTFELECDVFWVGISAMLL